MKNIKESFGDNLRKLRKSKKLTIDTLAEMSDISSRLLSNIEAGDTFLSAESLCKLCVALEIEPKVLFDFDWYDKFMYYDEGKYIRPHFKAILKNKNYELKSLPQLKDFKVNKILPIGALTQFLMEFSKDNKMTIYIDFLTDKKRDKVVKYTPDGTFSFLCSSDEIQEKAKDLKNKKYDEALEKIKEFSNDKKKIEYIIMAANALNDEDCRDKLRIMLDAMDISK